MALQPKKFDDIRLQQETIRNMQRKKAPKSPKLKNPAGGIKGGPPPRTPQLKPQTKRPMNPLVIRDRRNKLKKPDLESKTKAPMSTDVIKNRKNHLKKPDLEDKTKAPMSTDVIKNRKNHLKKPKLNNPAGGIKGGPPKGKPQLNSKTKRPMNSMVIKDRKNKIKKPKLDSSTQTNMKGTSEQKYPVAGFFFKVEIDGFHSEANFKEVSGLTAEREIELIVEGGNNDFVHKVPKGATKYNNLVLKRGLVSADSAFAKWCLENLQSVLSQVIKPKTINVELQDTYDAKPVMKWSFTNAWPVKWEVSSFDSQKSEIVIESIEFAYNSFSVS